MQCMGLVGSSIVFAGGLSVPGGGMVVEGEGGCRFSGAFSHCYVSVSGVALRT